MSLIEMKISRAKFCSWCIVKDLVSCTIGLRIYRCDCFHSTLSYGYRRYSISWRLVAVNFLTVASLIYFIYLLVMKLCEEDSLLGFTQRTILAYVMTMLGTLSALFVSPWNFKNHVAQLEMLNYIVEIYFPPEKAESEMRLLRRFHCRCGKLLAGQSIALFLLSCFDGVLYGTENILQDIGLLITMQFYCSVILTSIGFVRMVKSTIREGCAQLKRALKVRLKRFRKGLDEMVAADRFAEELCKYVMINCDIKRTCELNYDSFTCYLPIAMVAILSHGVIQFSLMADLATNAELKKEQIKVGVIMLTVGIVAMLYLAFLLAYLDTMQPMVDDLISVLLKGARTRLTPREVLLMEVVIRETSVKRFEVNIGDLFVVDSQLIATLFGVLVTYILVVVQFTMAN